MYLLNSHSLSAVSGGETCELITHVYSLDMDEFFDYTSKITGDCEELRAALEAGKYEGSKEKWISLGYVVDYKFVIL